MHKKHTSQSLHIKSPLPLKTLKNNTFLRGKRGSCRQNILYLRTVYIDAVLLFILFLFFVTYVYSYDRSVKIKCRNGGGRGGL